MIKLIPFIICLFVACSNTSQKEEVMIPPSELAISDLTWSWEPPKLTINGTVQNISNHPMNDFRVYVESRNVQGDLISSASRIMKEKFEVNEVYNFQIQETHSFDHTCTFEKNAPILVELKYSYMAEIFPNYILR
jgi:hypothetical protein